MAGVPRCSSLSCAGQPALPADRAFGWLDRPRPLALARSAILLSLLVLCVIVCLCCDCCLCCRGQTFWCRLHHRRIGLVTCSLLFFLLHCGLVLYSDLPSFGVGLNRLRLASLSVVLWVGASMVLLCL